MGAPDDLPLGRREEIDRLADQFEREFKAGDQPQIEDYLQQHPQLRGDLLRELLATELGLRREAGDQPSVEEYHQRFPEDREIVETAMSPEMDRTIAQQPDPGEQYEAPPERLGRYEIRRVLGRGAFGVVYLAHDPQLHRPVALKVPRRKRFQTAEQVASFIHEARTAANLKHQSLVAVYDVQEDDGLPFIVQEYIDGQNLREWAARDQPSFVQIARVIAGVAEALGYAHQQGLTHCDLKLANVLMDTAGRPHVADFGLAVHESAQSLCRGEVFGTPATMAPEQVRGESHRLDGRTDMWAIGVMLYELLVGRKPFTAKSREELYAEIQGHDPRPPRQIDNRVPRELERICLKCLSKRRTERFNTTDDLREDLLAWLGEEPSTQATQSTTVVPTADSSSGSAPVRIIPKGLRSFDAEDAYFFLGLLPGPRDRDGLPESIRFWKHRIEETDPDKTFSVGLIYGPSGCGKSSLVKAGLLPRLSDKVLPIYADATAADTEVRILKQLRKHFPRLPMDSTLPDACAELRLTGAGRDRKVLLVLDQFEQWLHSHAELKNAQLVDALRQCEGGRLQTIVLVRDDFYAGVNQLFQELEVRLLEGQNYALVPRFSIGHAANVLAAFGRSYGALPETIQPEHEQFLAQAVSELAEEGQVISVRLALFADLLKTRPWIRATLREVGGVGGVGVTFLEETFSAKTAPPSHRAHEKAIRGALKALLPDAGSDIKGSLQSVSELREAAGYQDTPQRFEELIQILDGNVRLVTPTEPDDTSDEDGVPAGKPKYYQLTHDYLVPSLREWLTRKQKETRRGRAEIRLAELSVAWNARAENRHLPGWWEYLNIRILTHRSKWTEPEQKMMRKADRVQGSRIAVVACLIAAILGGSLFGIKRYRTTIARGYVEQLANTTPEGVQPFVELLRPLRAQAVPLLEDVMGSVETSENGRLHSLCALAEFGDVRPREIVAHISTARHGECPNIISALKHAGASALPELAAAVSTADRERDWNGKARMAIVALYLGEPSFAADMLAIENRPDPIQRTVFIRELPLWRDNLVELQSAVNDHSSGPFRSGICLAIGGIAKESITDAEKDAWRSLLQDWHQAKPDAGTHSASGWAMRQWELTLPEIEPTRQPADGLQWHLNTLGLTMLQVPSGCFTRQDGDARNGEPQIVAITRDFWLSDREINIRLFRQFVDDKDYSGMKPEKWEGAAAFDGETDTDFAAQQVSWFDAIMFCNWLSFQFDDLKPYYKVVRTGDLGTRYTVTPLHTNGFRLPTEAEWEYACRAGTTTHFSFGDPNAFLDDYGVYAGNSDSRTGATGSRLCNPWGFFDMHGNVSEWCWDQSDGMRRVYRGGSWHNAAADCRSSIYVRSSADLRANWVGFRVARCTPELDARDK